MQFLKSLDLLFSFQESKRHLGSLTSLGIGSMVQEITKDGADDDDSDQEQPELAASGKTANVTSLTLRYVTSCRCQRGDCTPSN